MQNEKFRIGRFWLDRRRNSPFWYIYWSEPGRDGRYQVNGRSTRTADFQEAQLQLAEHALEHERPKGNRPEDVMVQEALLVYWKQHGSKLASADGNSYCLGYWSEYFDGKHIAEVTLDAQEAFADHLRAEGLSSGYIHRIFAIGAAAINRAWKTGRVTHVPYIKLPKETNPSARILLPDETRALFKAIQEPHGYDYFLLAFSSAARQEAILQLAPPAVDLHHRLVDFNPPGREQNNKRRPVLPITESIYPIVEDEDVPAFVRYRGKPLKSIKKLIKGTAERAGIGHINSRTIRHTMATEMRKAGVEEWELRSYLGHGRATTTDRYAKYQPNYLGQAARVVDDYLRSVEAVS